MSLYREDLDSMTPTCAIPGCPCTREEGDMWLHASCHIRSPTWVAYRGGRLRIECAKCGREVMTVKVASRPPTTASAP